METRGQETGTKERVAERSVDVEDILKQWLKDHGYTALVGDYCGCSIGDLMPCRDYCGACRPGYWCEIPAKFRIGAAMFLGLDHAAVSKPCDQMTDKDWEEVAAGW